MRALELDRHPHVLRFGGEIGEPEAERIGPELLDDVERIDAVPLRFRHPLAVAVENFRMDEDLVERHFADVVQAGQHHPRHPKRDDVAAGDQHVGRIVVFQFLGLLRPAERGMRPKGGTEPSVENVRALADNPRRSQSCSFELVAPRTHTRRLSVDSSRVLTTAIVSVRQRLPSCSSASGIRRLVVGLSRFSYCSSGFEIVSACRQSQRERSLHASDLCFVESAVDRLRYHTGIRCPHQSCRLMGQSRFSPSQSR